MDTKLFNKNQIDIAANIIKNNGLVAFPTETVYGLGANGLSKDAVEKIFIAKGRPSDNPLILHVASKSDVYSLVDNVPFKAKKLMDFFWPGPLTIVFKKSHLIPDSVSCGLDSVAIRMPDNKIALELIKKSGLPIAAPSANTSGKPSPTSYKHVYEDLNGKIDGIIRGGRTKRGIESTVIDLTSKIPIILRPGLITIDDIKSVIGKVREYSQDLKVVKSPGMKYKHYSPKANVIFVDCENYHEIILELTKELENVYIFCTNKESKYSSSNKFIGNSPITISKNLFYEFRRVDNLGFKNIIVEKLGNGSKWAGIRNRLEKASSKVIL